MEGSQRWYKPHRLLGSSGVCDTLGVTRLRLVTPWVYPIHHSFLGVYLSRGLLDQCCLLCGCITNKMLFTIDLAYITCSDSQCLLVNRCRTCSYSQCRLNVKPLNVMPGFSLLELIPHLSLLLKLIPPLSLAIVFSLNQIHRIKWAKSR